jgi:hypothetical protein
VSSEGSSSGRYVRLETTRTASHAPVASTSRGVGFGLVPEVEFGCRDSGWRAARVRRRRGHRGAARAGTAFGRRAHGSVEQRLAAAGREREDVLSARLDPDQGALRVGPHVVFLRGGLAGRAGVPGRGTRGGRDVSVAPLWVTLPFSCTRSWPCTRTSSRPATPCARSEVGVSFRMHARPARLAHLPWRCCNTRSARFARCATRPAISGRSWALS